MSASFPLRWRAVSLLAVGAVGLAVLTGCSSSNSAAALTKTLTIAASSAPGSLNPLKDTNGGTQTYYQELAYEPLIDRTANGKYVAGLATSWGYVSGHPGTEFEVTLRKGAKFADGSAVTAKAVAASLNYFIKNASGSSAGSYVGLSVVTSGSNKVIIDSKTANPVIEDLLTPYNLGGNIISPKGLANASKLANETFGAGPYVYDAAASVAGDHYTYTPNKQFYDQSQIHFAKVVIKVIANNQSALSALRTGQIDLFNGDTTVVSAAKSAHLTIQSGVGSFTGMFLMDWNGKLVSALGNEKVRQALNYAIDRKSITTAVYGKYGVPTDQPNTPGWDAYLPSLQGHYSYDPTKAKQLLSQAGYSSGFTFSMIYPSFQSDATKIAQAVAADYAKVGVTMTLVAVPDFSTLVADINSKKYTGFALGWGGQTQFANANQLWGPDGSVNVLKNTNTSTFNKAFSAYLTSTTATRDSTAQAVQTIAVDEGLSLPVSQVKSIWISSPKLKGFELGSGGSSNNIDEWSK
jgi:peptide/nickel transport system substrate-binding protein